MSRDVVSSTAERLSSDARPFPNSRFAGLTSMTLATLRRGACPARSFRFEPLLMLLLCGGIIDPAPTLAQSSPLNRIERTNYEDPPISYSDSTPDDAVIDLRTRIDAGEMRIDGATEIEKLAAILDALDVPRSSQVLTFGKTSLQADKVTPSTPRAIYFSDSIQIGHMPGGVVEIIAADPRLGVNFYTYDPKAEGSGAFVRETNRCLTCHGAAKTLYVPGLQVRSVLTDPAGQPVLSAGSRRTDQSSPFEERWGGWYVTGTHGSMRHMGNECVANPKDSASLDRESGANVEELSSRIRTEPYRTEHSDLVALMVLEHQSLVHNLITLANYETRLAEHYDSVMNAALDRPADHRSDSTERRIAAVVDKLVDGLLMVDEFRFDQPIAGTSGYSEVFARQGKRDSQGRSLRDLDLRTRLFRYPCSYLIDTPHFDSLPDTVRKATIRRLWEVLTAPTADPRYAHLTDEDRKAIVEILNETKPELFAEVR
ncbi:MAG TPA: hypothetical protein DCQ98_03865 [Planctomycetaceae bacterium]|nr:hypothetical protein [Planctomycetaceae bacterium]